MELREKRLEPLRQRLGRLVDALGSRRWVKRQRVYLVRSGGLELKRIEMTDSSRAEKKEAALRVFAATGLLPRPVARHHADLWVEFLHGEPVRADAPDLAPRFAALLATLYGTGAERRETSTAHGPEEVARDLDILARAGVLGAGQARDLARRAEAEAPASLWVGFDHTDLLLKNILRRDDRSLCLIDIESVVSDEAVGTGFAKACHRWIGDRREEFLAAVKARPEIPDFVPYLPYLEIRFLAAWTKRSLLLGKSKLVDPDAFRRWAASDRPSGS
jgi:hypothetical protein